MNISRTTKGPSFNSSEGDLPVVDRLREVQAWHFPEFFNDEAKLSSMFLEGAAKASPAVKKTSDDTLQDGFSRGFREGKAKANKEIDENRERFGELLEKLSKPFHDLDQEIGLEMVSLAMRLARQIVYHEIDVHPEKNLLGAVQEAFSMLPASSRKIRLIMNPKDVLLVEGLECAKDAQEGWAINVDESMSRGDFRVETDVSSIDGTVDKRIDRVFKGVLGDCLEK